jgi:type IV secretory pathway TrbL component
MVWPTARGFLRKTIEVLVAVILSKFVICVALAIGVAALSGAGETAGTDSASAGLGALLVGAVLLGLAAFSPFIVLKLVPAVEAAVVAHGVSRGPLRAAQSGAASYSTVTRLAGGSGSSRSSGEAAGAFSAAPVSAETAGAGSSAAGASAAGGSAGVAAGAATAGIALASVPARRARTSAEQSVDRRSAGDAPGAPPAPAPQHDRGERP